MVGMVYVVHRLLYHIVLMYTTVYCDCYIYYQLFLTVIFFESRYTFQLSIVSIFYLHFYVQENVLILSYIKFILHVLLFN